MKKITYECLNEFCEKDNPMRPITAEPHFVDGMWIATNGHILLAANKSVCDDNIPMPKNKDFVPYESVINNDGNKEYTILLSDILDAFGKTPKVEEYKERKLRKKFENCTACDDGIVTGYVQFRGKKYDYQCECPVCLGVGRVPVSKKFDPSKKDIYELRETEYIKTGKMVADEFSTFDINGFKLYYKNIKLLKEIMEMLEEKEATLFSKDGGNYIVFKTKDAYLAFVYDRDNLKDSITIKITEKL